MLTLLAYANAIVLTKYSHLHRPTRTPEHSYCVFAQIKIYILSECKKGTEHKLCAVPVMRCLTKDSQTTKFGSHDQIRTGDLYHVKVAL